MHASEAPRAPIYRAVILTALSVEYQAVRAHLSDPQEDRHPEGTLYERGRFCCEQGLWEVLLVEVGAGNPRAALETERALHYFRPQVVLFVGVAGGLKDVRLGDVVVASKVYGYESGKALTRFQPRPDVGEGSYALEQRARGETRREGWLQRLGGTPPACVPRVLIGAIAAGEKVLAATDSELYRFLREQYGDALAVDMEARGFLTAARSHRRVEALVIRGISDIIDGKSEADAAGSQELASGHASAFAFELLARFVPSGESGAREPIWNVPYPRNRNFTGRGTLLQDIRTHFLAEPAGARPLALHGLGGIGKTQVALEYANCHAWEARDYTHVLWVRADEPAILATSYAALAQELELPERVATEQSEKVSAVRRWLQANPGWLLVFDNAETPGVLEAYLPPALRGHVLITSRNPAWGQMARALPVPELDLEEAVAFLHHRTGQDHRDAAELLAAALGGLPLALAQAAAYIEETGKSLADYLRLFEQRHKELLERPGAPPDYPHTVAATWSLSFEEVQARAPASAALLALCSFLAPTPIPLSLLTEGARWLPAPLPEALSDEVLTDELVGVLRRYSLVQVHERSLLFHRLVQVVMRERLKDGAAEWARAALELVHDFFIFDHYDLGTWARCSLLLPHAIEATEQAWSRETGLEMLPGLLRHLGHFWEEQAEYALAAEFLTRGLGLIRKFPSASPHDEAALLHSLAVVELETGHLSEAREHLGRAMEIVRGGSGEEQKRTLSLLLNVLACLDAKCGRMRDARVQAEQALALLESVVDGDQTLIAAVSSTLGGILEQQADYAQARVHVERSLRISQTRFGELHPKVAMDRYVLANVLESLGRYVEARDQMIQALETIEILYGPEHPRGATILRSLGHLHERLGSLEQARACCERALRIDEARLGPEHLHVALDLNNLAKVLHAQGDLAGARARLERALAIEEQGFGADHHELATGLDNLGRILEGLGELEQARERFTRALAAHERINGPEHPRVANVLNNLGTLLHRMKELPQARQHLERALAIDEQRYGPSHPEVAIDLCNLGMVLLDQGEESGGQDILLRALAIYDAHPELPASTPCSLLVTLGRRHHARGEWAQAREYLARALKLQEKAEPSPAEYIESRLIFGVCLKNLEEHAEAVTVLEEARARLGDDVPLQVRFDILLTLGTSYRELGRVEQSRASLEAAHRLAEETGRETLLSHVRFEQGRLARFSRELHEARRIIEQVWERRNVVELERPDTVLTELGLIQEALGDIASARTRFEEALLFAEKVRGPDSSAVATVSGHLGRMLTMQGDRSAAILQLERALSIRERINGPSSISVAHVLRHLAEAKLFSPRHLEAADDARRALSLYSASPAAPGRDVAGARLVLGAVAWASGALNEAQVHMQGALSALESDSRTQESELIPLWAMLGTLYAQQRDVPRARAILERALAEAATASVPQAAIQVKLTRQLGRLCDGAGDLAGARTYFTRAVELHASLPEATAAECALDHVQLAHVLRQQRVTILALEHTEKAVQLLAKVPQTEVLVPQVLLLQGGILLEQERWQESLDASERALRSPASERLSEGDKAILQSNLGLAWARLGAFKPALVHLEKAVTLAAKLHGTEHPEYALALSNLAGCLVAAGKKPQAIKKLKRALAIYERQTGPEHVAAEELRRYLAVLSSSG